MDNTIGQRLYTARKKKGLTRKTLGEMMSLHETTVKRYEDGHFKGMDIEKLQEFANALDVDVLWLWGGPIEKSGSLPDKYIDLTGFNSREIEKIKTFVDFVRSEREKEEK